MYTDKTVIKYMDKYGLYLLRIYEVNGYLSRFSMLLLKADKHYYYINYLYISIIIIYLF